MNEECNQSENKNFSDEQAEFSLWNEEMEQSPHENWYVASYCKIKSRLKEDENNNHSRAKELTAKINNFTLPVKATH